MIKFVFVLLVIYLTLCAWYEVFTSDYDKCYDDMETDGYAAFECCSGICGGTNHTNYLSEMCVSCPYFVDNHM